MKKAFIVVVLCFVALSSSAQKTDWTWKNLIFEVPRGFQVEQNSDEIFEGSLIDVLSLTLTAFNDVVVSENNIIEVCTKLASESGYGKVKETGRHSSGSLVGEFVDVTNDEGGHAVFFGMIDRNTGESYLAVIVYVEGKDKVVSSVINSFKLADKNIEADQSDQNSSDEEVE